MNPATLIVWCITIYSIIIGFIMIGFSVLSLLAYGCVLNYFEDNPILNMLYFLYFRNAKCGSFVNWSDYGYLNFLNSNSNYIQPIMPSQTKAVHDTFVLTQFYLGFNITLVCACIMAMCKCYLCYQFGNHRIMYVYFDYRRIKNNHKKDI